LKKNIPFIVIVALCTNIPLYWILRADDGEKWTATSHYFGYTPHHHLVKWRKLPPPFSTQSDSRYMHIINNTWNMLKRSEILRQTSEERPSVNYKVKLSLCLIS
jgi:hypothetical protein